jgi:hypothetical protein
MVRVPRSFVNETLWPQYLDLSTTLRNYLEDITNRVIAEGVHGDTAEEDIIAGDLPDTP